MSNKTVFYWDACMFYEVLGNEPAEATKRAGAQAVLDANKKEENIIITSVVTHLEVLPSKLTEKGADDLADYLGLFDAKHFVEIELSTNIILRAREIREFYYVAADKNGHGAKMMDVGDALHLATASIHGAHQFHTRDNKKKKGNVPLLTLYESTGTGRLCDRYALDIVSPEAQQGALDV